MGFYEDRYSCMYTIVVSLWGGLALFSGRRFTGRPLAHRCVQGTLGEMTEEFSGSDQRLPPECRHGIDAL